MRPAYKLACGERGGKPAGKPPLPAGGGTRVEVAAEAAEDEEVAAAGGVRVVDTTLLDLDREAATRGLAPPLLLRSRELTLARPLLAECAMVVFPSFSLITVISLVMSRAASSRLTSGDDLLRSVATGERDLC